MGQSIAWTQNFQTVTLYLQCANRALLNKHLYSDTAFAKHFEAVVIFSSLLKLSHLLSSGPLTKPSANKDANIAGNKLSAGQNTI